METEKLIDQMIEIRKEQGVTQSAIAEMIGTSQQIISRIERKEVNPTIKMFCRILHVLGYTLELVKKETPNKELNSEIDSIRKSIATSESKFFKDTMQGLLEAVEIESKEQKESS